jgi:bacterioferritin (cytochrome b1)
MSELDKTKRELIEVLDKIPGSGSFEGAELMRRADELTDRVIALNSLPSAHDVEDAAVPTESK